MASEAAGAASPDGWRTADELPRVDLSSLDGEERRLALDFLRTHDCTCGCTDLTIAQCAYLDPVCPAIPVIATALVEEIHRGSRGDRLRALVLSSFPPRRPPDLGLAYLDPSRHFPLDDAPTLGARDAKVTLVVFTDLTNAACANMVTTERGLVQNFGSRVRFVYQLVPPPGGPADGWIPAMAALAASEQGAFWQAYLRLFAECGYVTRESALIMASEMGLELERFRRDLDDPALRVRIESNRASAAAAGFSSAPGYSIDSRPMRGSRLYPSFDRLLREALDTKP